MRLEIVSVLAITLIASLFAAESAAQSVDAGISGAGLLSIQPIDDAYVGGPYLNEGIGGIGPGFAAAVDMTSPRGLVAGVEFSTAYYELQQSGRLVGSPPGGTVTTRLRDSLVSGLVGFSLTPGRTSMYLRAGAGVVIGAPTVNGVEVMESAGDGSSHLPLALTGGVDLRRGLSPRTSLIITARYAFLARDESLRFLGIGPHVLRVGGGVRVRLN